jgi:hypothetical protein
MMFMMISKMEAGQQRHKGREVVTARPVAIDESIFFDPMGAIRAEVKQLHG